MTENQLIKEILAASIAADSEAERQEAILTVIAAEFKAVAAIVWIKVGKHFEPETQIQHPSLDLPELRLSQAEHESLLANLDANAKPEFFDDITTEPNWTLVATSFVRSGETRVLELLLHQNFDSSNTTVRGQLVTAMELGTKFLMLCVESQDLPPTVDRSITESQTDPEFPILVHKSIDYSKATDTIANELRRELDVDRVTVLRKKGSQWVVQAISGQVKVNRRSGTLQKLTTLATRTLATRQSFFYPSSVEPLPQIEDALRAYLDQSETRFLAIRSVEILDDHPDARQSENPNALSAKTIGAIVVENFREVLDVDQFSSRFDKCYEHSASALRNAYQHQQLFLYPLWRLLGKSKLVIAARNLRTSLAILAAVLVVSLILCFWPANFNVIAKGVLVPVERQKVFAELDGIVIDVPVDHLSKVKSGQTIVKLVNEDLEFQKEQVNGEILELRQRLNAIQAGRISTTNLRETGQEDNAKGIRTQLSALTRLYETLEAKSDRLNVKSPILGEIITWDVKERLLNRPVQPSELLVEVANVAGQWELEVNVPSRKVGHILRAKDRLNELHVVYAIASEPGVWRDGKVVAIEGAAKLQSDQSQSISLRVKIDLQGVRYPANTGVVAKIYCGRRSFGYVWVHDAWEYVQENVIFRVW